MNITLTDSAVNYIKEKLAKNANAKGFRLSVKKTGCSGYSYAPTLVETKMTGDIAIDAPQGITLYLDPMYAHLLEGVVIDYREEKVNGLKQKKLVFTNPNENGRCGCGESFHVE